MKEQKNKNTWVKPRHKRWWRFANFVLAPIIKCKYNVKIQQFEDADKQALVICNHQTPFDQFFISRMLKNNFYFICTEDLFSIGFASNIIRHCVAPIPIQKGALDIGTIKTCARIVKEGGSIALFPEGNRTYSGQTCYVKPAIAKLVKFLKLPLVILHQEGGYGLEPRWSDKVRKGKGRIYHLQTLQQSEYSQMTDDELYQYICKQLYTDESAGGGSVYRSNRRAEYIERAMYVCPHCGLTTFLSHKNTFRCTKCNTEVEYGIDKKLSAIKGQFPFETVGQWYQYQYKFINELSLDLPLDTPLYQDEVRLSKVVVGKKKQKLLKKATLYLYPDRLEFVCKDKTLLYKYDDVTGMACMGRNKLNFHHGDTLQVKGDKRFNAMKYMNIFYRYKNVKEANDDTFLGI